MKRLPIVWILILCMQTPACVAEDSTIGWHTSGSEVWNDAGEHFAYEIEEGIGDLRLTAIEDNAFNAEGMDYDDEKVECIVIPEGVTELREDSFLCAYGVQKIELPSSLEEISSDDPFGYVSAEISFPNGNPYYREEDGFIIDIRTCTLVYCNPSASEKPLPRVKRIGKNALENYSFCQTTLEFPDTVEFIGTFNPERRPPPNRRLCL